MVNVLFIFSLTASIFHSTCTALEIPDGGVFPTTENSDVYLQLLQRVENLEKRDHQQQVEIDTLRGELNSEKQRTAVLEGRLVRLQTALAKQSENDDVKPIIDKAKKPSDTEFKEQESIPSTEADSPLTARSAPYPGGHTSKIRRHINMPVVAFHATLSSDAVHTGILQSIVFDNVVTNIGSAYNRHIGSFVAPVAGVYVFHATLQVDDRQETWARIAKNGISVVNLYFRGFDSPWNSHSATAVLHLNKSDAVMVENNHADASFDGGHFCIFSGFLLYQDGTSSTLAVVG